MVSTDRLQERQFGGWSHRRKWGARAVFAVFDQALISGSNFLLGIVLARRIHATGYGAYALAFSAFSLLLVLDQAVILEPMSVFGGSKYRSSLRRYLGNLLNLQTVFGVVCFGLLVASAAGVYMAEPSNELYLALVGIGIATPAILLLYFTRRALYVEYRSRTAAGGAVIYCVLLFSGLWVVSDAGVLSAFAAFLVMGASSLATSLLLLIYIRPGLKGISSESKPEVAKEHWVYGRWALAAALFTWMSWNVWYAILASFAGLAASGTLRALINLAMPVIQSCAVLSLLVLPHTARIVHGEGWAGAKRQAVVVGTLFAAGATAYWLLVLIFQTTIIDFLYSGRYADSARYLKWLALASIASAATVGPVSALRALEKPSLVCAAFLISVLAGLIVGIPATHIYGTGGAICGVLISSLLAMGIAAWLLGRTAATSEQGCALAMSETFAE
jgi:O-antigen/teichoic acid export membrane protein